MEQFKIYARILCNNVVGHTAYFQIRIRGLRFKRYLIPAEYPVQTLALDDEILIHFGDKDEMTEEEIAVLVANQDITIDAVRNDDKSVTFKYIKPVHMMDIPFGERISIIEQTQPRKNLSAEITQQ